MHTLKYKTVQVLNRLYSRKKRLLCYGDSNTWGYIPGSAGRYAFNQRWPGVLQNELAGRVRVFEDGLSGRTTIYDDPFEKNLNGEKHLLAALKRCTPLDLVILMLGTNDLKFYFNLQASDIAKGAMQLCQDISVSKSGPNGVAPEILLIAPATIKWLPEVTATDFEDAMEKSEKLAESYATAARNLGIEFMDAAPYVGIQPVDGIHWDVETHRNFGHAVAESVRTILQLDGNNSSDQKFQH
jgi:lysophospholipase L1-like esterase